MATANVVTLKMMRKMTLSGAFQGSSVRVRVRFQYSDKVASCPVRVLWSAVKLLKSLFELVLLNDTEQKERDRFCQGALQCSEVKLWGQTAWQQKVQPPLFYSLPLIKERRKYIFIPSLLKVVGPNVIPNLGSSPNLTLNFKSFLH